MARIELPDGSQQPRIGIMVPEVCVEDVMAKFQEMQPDQPWLQVLVRLTPAIQHS